MIVWIVAGAMTFAAIAAVLVPLFRRQHGSVDSAAYDIEVYKDQLDKVGEDYDRGLLTAEQVRDSKTEISRRILSADRQRKIAAPEASQSRSTNRILAVVLALSIPALALGFYARVGAPDLPSQPFAERQSQGTQTASGQMSLSQSVTNLARRLQNEPDDLDGWILLGQTYKSLGQYREAVEAYLKARDLDAGDAELNSAYGEALYLAAQRIVTPASRKAFEEAVQIDAGEPRARYYLAMAQEQAGNRQAALDAWAAMVADAPADAPWLPSVRDQIAKVAGQLGLDAAAVTPQPKAPSAPPGPTAADRAAAANMSPEERQQMIERMIAGLANRLVENPMDFQGWIRLIRAYAVQDKTDAARRALATARKTFQAAPFPTRQLASLARELGLESEVLGPTRDDVAAAQEMSPDEQQAMIKSMVARLAGKLAENPNDVAGWTRLARSYNVLRQPEKARGALAEALKYAPDNVDLLVLYGRMIRGANGDKPNTQSTATMRRVLALAPDNTEALWFVGGAEAAAGNTQKARDLWQKALAQTVPGSRERSQLRQRLDALK
jgi:cytochrome c-type biogenesis protein CcmH